MKPFFSIIMPCCDVAQYIRESLDSVMKQSFGSWECICGIEESKDDTEKIIREIAANEPRIRIFTHPRSGSCSATRNVGTDMAQGEYVIFLDGDDTIEVESLARIAEKIQARPGADLYPGVIVAYVEGTDKRELRENYPPKCSPVELTGPEAIVFTEKMNPQPCPMLQLTVFRREFLIEHDLKCIYGLRRQDSEFSPRALYLAKRVVPLHEPFYLYRIRANSVSTAAKGPGHFLKDWAIITKSLFAFHAKVSREPGFDRRVSECWSRQWVSRMLYFWFAPRCIDGVPREHRLETLNIMFADGFDDLNALLRVSNSRRRMAGWWLRAFVRHPMLRGAAEAFFRTYFRLSGGGGEGGAKREAPPAKKKKVLIYFRSFGLTHGGSEYLPLTFIAELQKSCDVTLALDWVGHLDMALAFYGIPIDKSRLKIVQLMPEGYLPTQHGLRQSYRRFRKLKKLAKQADIRISCANVMDFGLPAHHFLFSLDLGDAGFAEYVRSGGKSGAGAPGCGGEKKLMRHLLGMRTKREIVGDPRERIYPNSHYVDDLLRGYYGDFKGEVFYPPTTFEFSPREVARDPLKVVYIGRLEAGKRIADIVAIVERARELSGLDVKLGIAGRPHSDAYRAELDKLAAERPWLEFVGELHDQPKVEFLLSAACAVHVMREEAFGISITEYLKTGIIPVVPDEGGAREVVDDAELCFHTNEEAAKILCRIMTDGEFRERKRLRCAERAGMFSLDAYMESQHKILKDIVGS